MKTVEKWSWSFEFLRSIGWFVHRLDHKRIVVKGLENIPKSQPVIFAPNHQNALSDALVLLLTTHEQPVFLARADIFKKKAIAHILNYFKLTPVYRIRDGKQSLDKNKEVFSNCARILSANKKIGIFPEAAHNGQKSLLPLKKAIPRIVFLTAEENKFDIDIKIIPVGIYYSHYYNFRRELFVHYGEPISSSTYYELYKNEGETKATSVLRNDITTALKKYVVHVDDKASYELYDLAFELTREKASEILGLTSKLKDKVESEQFITHKLNDCFSSNEQLKEKLLSKAKRYRELQIKLNLNDVVLAKGKSGLLNVIRSFILALITSPLSIIGIVVNGWLFYLSHYYIRRKLKDKQFYSSFAFALSFIIGPFWFIALFFILKFIFSSWLISLIILAVSLPGEIIAWECFQSIRKSLDQYRMKKLLKKGNENFNELVLLRSELISFFVEKLG